MTDGQKINELRQSAKMTYENLAGILGVDPITVRNWEKQERLKPLYLFAVKGAVDSAEKASLSSYAVRDKK